MNKLILIVLFLYGWSAQAVNIPQASSVISGGGGIAQTTPSSACPLANIDTCGAVMICGGQNSSTTGNFYQFYKMNAGGGQYFVPNAKSFYATSLWVVNQTNNFTPIELGYATASFSDNASSNPTGAIFYGRPAISAADTATGGYPVATANVVTQYYPLGLTFPANSYPFWRGTSANTQSICIQGIVK